MAESKDFTAEAGSAKVVGTVSSTDIAEPVAPPLGMRAVGPRITFHFVGEWNAETSYVLYDVVRVNGTSYIANKITIAKGVNPETDNNAHWVKWNDPNAQVELLQQTVNGFDARIAEAETEAMNAAGDAAEAKKASADNATAINAEATRAKAAEAANAAAAATAEQKASANETAIANEVSRATAADAVNARPFKKIVVISDSYGRGVGAADEKGWVFYLNEYTHAVYLNKSNSGAGFVHKGHSGSMTNMNFQQQTDLAATEAAANASAVDLVLFGGGYNDIAFNETSNDCYANAKAAAINAKVKFPNAEVKLMQFYPIGRNLTSSNARAFSEMAKGFAAGGGQVFEMMKYALCCDSASSADLMNSDGIHPTEDGYRVIARSAVQLLNGGDLWLTQTPYASGITFAEGVSNEDMRCGIVNGFAFIVGGVKCATMTNRTTLFTLPKSPMLPTDDVRYFTAFAFSSDGAALSKLALMPDGRMIAQTPLVGSYHDNMTIYFQPCAWPTFII